MDNEKEMMENLDTPQESLNARSRRNRDRKREQRKGKNGKGMVIGIIILVVIIGIIAVLVFDNILLIPLLFCLVHISLPKLQ